MNRSRGADSRPPVRCDCDGASQLVTRLIELNAGSLFRLWYPLAYLPVLAHAVLNILAGIFFATASRG